MRNLFLILLLFCAIVIPHSTFATHLIGGDLTYSCLGNNRYKLEITLYQDCTNPGETSAAIAADTPLHFAIYSGNLVQNPSLNTLYTSGSLRDFNFSVVPLEFSNECVSNIPRVCMRASKFETIITLPPNRDGYTILYQRCCRNHAVLNLMDPGNEGITLYNYIPPFANNQCSNNSAYFRKVPPQIICKDNPFRYDFSAIDPDGDSLVYRLCAAIPGGSATRPTPQGNEIFMPGRPLNYRPPLSAQNPINAFPPIEINPITGEMTGKPSSMGRYIVTVCVDEYRNGNLINTISRDVQFTITDCSKNVIADIPPYPGFTDVIDVQCATFTVNFQNTSIGGFNYLWHFGDGSTSTDKNPSHTYADTGVYEVKLIVNPGSSCPDSILRKVWIYPYYTSEIKWEGDLCPGDTVYLTEESVNTLGGTYTRLWQVDTNTYTDKTIQIVSKEDGGPVTVKLFTENSYGCRDTNEVVIPFDKVIIDAGNDTIIVKGYTYHLNASGAVRYEWLQPHWVEEPFNPKSKVNFPDTGVYELVLKGYTENDCIAYDTVVITVLKQPYVFLPNAFSPNGDGLNDYFNPTMVGYSYIKYFEIFNRYGQLVHKTTVSNGKGWDGTFNGKKCDAGVYYYRIVAVAPEGLEEFEMTGDVTLLR